jgi:hypothetical protein
VAENLARFNATCSTLLASLKLYAITVADTLT